MKKRIILLACLCLIAFLCACHWTDAEKGSEMLQPVRFYYADVSEEYGKSIGALGWELRELGPRKLTIEEVLRLYLQGPQSSELRAVLPRNVTVEQTALQDGVLTLTLGGGISDLSGIKRTVAAAGLVYTMEQFSDIDSVWIKSLDGALTDLFTVPLTKSDFLMFDDSATNDEVTVKLYFSDVNGRYLVQETRSRAFSSEEEIPAYVIQQLLMGPREKGRIAALPEGTGLLQCQLQDGSCTVNFSRAFLENATKRHGQARMAVLSVVNSLTELPQIRQVQFLCEGVRLASYMGLDLSQPWVRDETVIAQPAKNNTYDGTLYLVCGKCGQLVEVPKEIRRTTGRTLAEDMLTALQSYSSLNGYHSPIPQGAMAVDVNQRGTTCQVTFNSAFALCDENPQAARLAVRAVVSTLCALDGIEQVELKVYNETLTNVDLSKPLSPQPDWFLP